MQVAFQPDTATTNRSNLEDRCLFTISNPNRLRFIRLPCSSYYALYLKIRADS